MKRDEMLELISNTVLNQDTRFRLSLHEANVLLTQLENIGMRLPETGADVPYYVTNMHASNAPLEISMSEALAMLEPKPNK